MRQNPLFTLRTPRPATGVSPALRARSVSGSVPESVPENQGVAGSVRWSVSGVSKKYRKSVLGVLKRCPRHSGDTLGTLFGHSGARARRAPETLCRTPRFSGTLSGTLPETLRPERPLQQAGGFAILTHLEPTSGHEQNPFLSHFKVCGNCSLKRALGQSRPSISVAEPVDLHLGDEEFVDLTAPCQFFEQYVVVRRQSLMMDELDDSECLRDMDTPLSALLLRYLLMNSLLINMM